MRFTLGITTKYIDRNPTTSMTNNPLALTLFFISCYGEEVDQIGNSRRENII
jgi:hypothetical protein